MDSAATFDITPEMLEAGVSALHDFKGELVDYFYTEPELIVTEVFRAMSHAQHMSRITIAENRTGAVANLKVVDG